ncbi:MAG TPA: glycosyltransferase family 87 protein, partial [Anaerolineaceae bacterium]|nr:glycosyltransferase family 87 protein [Anaerolineaceae bacterium]
MMKRYRKTTISQYVLMAILLVSVIAVGLLGYMLMSHVPFTDNFVIPWAAGRTWLLAGESPYGESVIVTATEAIENSPFMANLPESPVFSQPLLSIILYAPFSLLPYTISRTLWVMVLVVSVCLSGLLSIKLSGWKLTIYGKLIVILVLVLWLPGINMIISGNLSPVIFGLILTAIYLILNGQETTGGFLLALTFSSFLTSGMVLIYILIWSISRKQSSTITSFLSGVAVLVILSFLVLPSWFMAWASVLLNLNVSLAWVQTPLMILSTFLPGIAEPLSILLHGVVIIFAVVLLIISLGKSGRIFIYTTFTFFITAYLLHVRGSTIQLLFIVAALLLTLRYWS